MKHRPHHRLATQGFTLIEIMVVLVIVALVSGASVRGFQSLTKADLRAATVHLSGAIRYLFDRASTTGKVHRLVIDVSEGKYWAEESDDRFYVPHEAETEADMRRREEKEAEQDQDEKRKQELKARADEESSASSSSSFDPSKLEIGDFQPKRARFAAFKEVALNPVELKKVKITSVYTPRVTDAITAGRAYLYFFPLGQTEPAIITLSDPKGKSVFSLVVHPITGRVRIYNEEIRPPGTQAQVDDEGKTVVQ